jgi:hypothetical protein
VAARSGLSKFNHRSNFVFQRVTDIFPHKGFIAELVRLARLDRNWVEITSGEGPAYHARSRHETWLKPFMQRGADITGLWATSIWLADGPKVFRPTLSQCHALEHVEVRLNFEDYAQPYPALMVDLPDSGDYKPFIDVLCFQSENLLVFNLRTPRNVDDIVTTIARYANRGTIEESLRRYDEDCSGLQGAAARALRVAANSCLALVGHEIAIGYLFPKEVENDRRLAGEKTERGERARGRLPLHVMLVAFQREVVLHKTEGGHSTDNFTGREMGCHWRRGHYAMQPYGPGSSLRKRIFRLPVLVREDKFLGDISDTTTVMRT